MSSLMQLLQYVSFKGRTSRKAFWLFVVGYFVAALLIASFEILIGADVILFLYTLVMLPPSIAIATRRLHDTGRSGWWQLIGLVSLVTYAIGWWVVGLIGVVIMIFLLARAGTVGENDFGPSPLVADVNQFIENQ